MMGTAGLGRLVPTTIQVRPWAADTSPASAGPFFLPYSTKRCPILGEMNNDDRRLHARRGNLAALYRHEPFIPATLKTAAANLVILRSQIKAEGLPFTSYHSTAAFRMAIEFERIVRFHSRKQTMQ